MTSTETLGRTIELHTFGGVVGRAAVDVQKALLERGFVNEAVDFNARLSLAIERGEKNLSSLLLLVKAHSKRDCGNLTKEEQIEIADKFTVLRRRGEIRFPDFKYRAVAEIPLPWGEAANSVSKRLDFSEKTMEKFTVSQQSSNWKSFDFRTKHAGIMVRIRPADDQHTEPRFALVVPSKLLLTIPRRSKEYVHL